MDHSAHRAKTEQSDASGGPFRLDPAAAASWLIPFGLVLYLGMERGGFDQRAWSEIGIVAWWVVILGLIAAALPAARVGRAGWIALGLLAAFAVWNAIGISWSESSGRSVVEVARVLTYLGVFAAAVLLGGRSRHRLVLGGVASAIAVIATLALLSRLHPSWFPENEIPQVLTGLESRLAYPLGYWNALAGLIAVGLPLVAWAAVSARSVATRALAGAAFPVMGLAVYYTFSRGGVATCLLSLLVLLALWPRRLALLLPGVVLLGGVAGLIWQATRRPSLADGLTTATAESQGDAMLVIVIVVALISAACMGALGVRGVRARLPQAPVVPVPAAAAGLGAIVVAGAIAFFAFGGPDRASEAFDDFKQPSGVGRDSSRLTSTIGNGRWQYWSTAIDAGAESPLTGIGPGTYVFYWAEHREIDNGFVRDAHSLFFEAFGELGVVGVLLIGGLVVFVVATGARRCFTGRGDDRLELAAATSAAAAFTVVAGVDWLWELAAIPVAFLLIAATIVRDRSVPEDEAAPAPERPRRAGLAVVPAIAFSAVAVAAIAIPMLGQERLVKSQDSFLAGDLESALSEAQGAGDLEPYDAAPLMQEAFVYEAMTPPRLSDAAAAAREATEREATNWETWYVLARIEAQREGREDAAKRALRRARALDPFNPALNPGGG